MIETPQHDATQILQLALMVTLYEKKTQSDLACAFAGLVHERHDEFHNEKVQWTECKNAVCVAAKQLITEAQKPSVAVSSIAFEAYKEYGLQIQGFGTGYQVKLVSPDEASDEEKQRRAMIMEGGVHPDTSPLVQLTDA